TGSGVKPRAIPDRLKSPRHEACRRHWRDSQGPCNDRAGQGPLSRRSTIPALVVVCCDAAPPDIGFDGELCIVGKAGPVDLIILHHALNVVACLLKRNALDPIDRVDAWIAWITVTLDPFLHAPTARVVGSKRKDEIAPVILDHPGDLRRA